MPRYIDIEPFENQTGITSCCVQTFTQSENTVTVRSVKTSDIPTIDPESLRPHGRCRYCSPEDGGGVEWDLEDIEVSMTLRCGKLTICNSFGDEADVPIRYCPICGAKMDLEEEMTIDQD